MSKIRILLVLLIIAIIGFFAYNEISAKISTAREQATSKYKAKVEKAYLDAGYEPIAFDEEMNNKAENVLKEQGIDVNVETAENGELKADGTVSKQTMQKLVDEVESNKALSTICKTALKAAPDDVPISFLGQLFEKDKEIELVGSEIIIAGMDIPADKVPQSLWEEINGKLNTSIQNNVIQN